MRIDNKINSQNLLILIKKFKKVINILYKNKLKIK